MRFVLEGPYLSSSVSNTGESGVFVIDARRGIVVSKMQSGRAQTNKVVYYIDLRHERHANTSTKFKHLRPIL